MAAESKIEWTDSTFSPWIGCTKISPACDNCYAEAQMDTRMGRVEWGAGKPRSRTSAAYWKQPLRWNAERFVECPVCRWRGSAADFKTAASPQACPGCGGTDWTEVRRRVFCASLADVFDNEVPVEWLVDLFDTIHRTRGLDWLLLTKRVGNVLSRVEAAIRRIEALPDWPDEGSARSHHLEPLRNWLADWVVLRKPLANVWIGATVVNQTEADRDIPKLLTVPAAKRFLSIEPMLGPVDLWQCGDGPLAGGFPSDEQISGERGAHYIRHGSPRIHWVICGGESGTPARPMHPDWARSLRDQCAAAGVPFLFKQWGEWRPPADGEDFNTAYGMSGKPPAHLVSPDGKVHCFYPHGDTAVRPQDSVHKAMVRVGKRAAGRQLDGREHSEWPA